MGQPGIFRVTDMDQRVPPEGVALNDELISSRELLAHGGSSVEEFTDNARSKHGREHVDPTQQPESVERLSFGLQY
jgi:hypothetical protein